MPYRKDMPIEERRLKNKEAHARYRKRHYEKVLERDRLAKKANPEQRRKIMQAYRARPENKIKIKARDMARYHLEPKPCEICGNTKTHAHHDDYNKPLEVRWLCRTHHMDMHYDGYTEERASIQR